MLKYAPLIGAASAAMTPCDGAMMMLHSMDPKENPVHSSMDTSHYKPGDNTVTVDKCRYGPMKGQGSVTWTCELTDNGNGVKTLTHAGDFTCVPKKPAKPVMMAVFTGAPAKMSFLFYVHVFEIPDFVMDFATPMAASCTTPENHLTDTMLTKVLYGQESNMVTGITRLLRAMKSHAPMKQTSPWMPDDLVGASAVTVTGCTVLKDNILECKADAITDVKKWWKGCKLDRINKNANFQKVRDATGNNPPSYCLGLQVMAPYVGLVPLSRYAVKFSNTPVLTQYTPNPGENKMCPKTAMEWNDNPLLEQRIAGSLNVGMLLFFVFPAILAGCCLPILCLICTCCCTCCCGKAICCMANKDRSTA